jgi:hypothetical protein
MSPANLALEESDVRETIVLPEADDVIAVASAVVAAMLRRASDWLLVIRD